MSLQVVEALHTCLLIFNSVHMQYLFCLTVGFIPAIMRSYYGIYQCHCTTVQAFRFMSHKFHGRGSGKKKTEKRIRRIQDEEVHANHVCIHFVCGHW